MLKKYVRNINTWFVYCVTCHEGGPRKTAVLNKSPDPLPETSRFKGQTNKVFFSLVRRVKGLGKLSRQLTVRVCWLDCNFPYRIHRTLLFIHHALGQDFILNHVLHVTKQDFLCFVCFVFSSFFITSLFNLGQAGNWLGEGWAESHVFSNPCHCHCQMMFWQLEQKSKLHHRQPRAALACKITLDKLLMKHAPAIKPFAKS